MYVIIEDSSYADLLGVGKVQLITIIIIKTTIAIIMIIIIPRWVEIIIKILIMTTMKIMIMK